jgi:hypothetical protein
MAMVYFQKIRVENKSKNRGIRELKTAALGCFSKASDFSPD